MTAHRRGRQGSDDCWTGPNGPESGQQGFRHEDVALSPLTRPAAADLRSPCIAVLEGDDDCQRPCPPAAGCCATGRIRDRRSIDRRVLVCGQRESRLAGAAVPHRGGSPSRPPGQRVPSGQPRCQPALRGVRPAVVQSPRPRGHDWLRLGGAGPHPAGVPVQLRRVLRLVASPSRSSVPGHRRQHRRHRDQSGDVLPCRRASHRNRHWRRRAMTALSTAPPVLGASAAEAVVLSCRSLRKAYGPLTAVRDLSLWIADGETYGLLGPNGAGKTTAISMVAGVLEPDAGEIVISGERLTVRAAGTRRHIGYVPQEVAVYPDLTARENLRFFARLYGMSRSDRRARTEEVLATIGLQERAGELVSKYSGGMRRRLNIGIGLLHRPRLLILDEPTVGVDPQSRNAILESVATLSAEGMAVLYTTHYMEEAERLCDRVGVLDEGRLIAEGTVRQLTALVGESDQVHVTAAGDL